MRLILTLTTFFAVMQSISAAGVEFADVGDARGELHHANIAPWRVPSIKKLVKGAVIAALLAMGTQQGAQFLKTENALPIRRAAVGAVNTGLSMSAKALQSMADGMREYAQDDIIEDYSNKLFRNIRRENGAEVLPEYESWKIKSELNRDKHISKTYRDDFLRMASQLTREAEEPHERNNREVLDREITSYILSHPDASDTDVFLHILPVSDEIRENIRTRFSRTRISAELLDNHRHMILPFLRHLERLENDAIQRLDRLQAEMIREL